MVIFIKYYFVVFVLEVNHDKFVILINLKILSMKNLLTSAFVLLGLASVYAQSNESEITQQSNYSSAVVEQLGELHKSTITQKNNPSLSSTSLSDGNKVTLSQVGFSSDFSLMQEGIANTSKVAQGLVGATSLISLGAYYSVVKQNQLGQRNQLEVEQSSTQASQINQDQQGNSNFADAKQKSGVGLYPNYTPISATINQLQIGNENKMTALQEGIGTVPLLSNSVINQTQTGNNNDFVASQNSVGYMISSDSRITQDSQAGDFNKMVAEQNGASNSIDQTVLGLGGNRNNLTAIQNDSGNEIKQTVTGNNNIFYANQDGARNSAKQTSTANSGWMIGLQKGDNNEMVLNQISGSNNAIVINQEGNGNDTTMTQDGYFNGISLNQKGDRNIALGEQDGRGNMMFLVQNGNANDASNIQSGISNTSFVTQKGEDNVHIGNQIGSSNRMNVNQTH